MERIENEYWVFYIKDRKASKSLDDNKCGKWMYFFSNKERADQLTSKAVELGIVVEAKYSNSPEGVCCFYLNSDDIESHKKIIKYFLENEMVQKTKTGKLYNISFKFDSQTIAGQYGDDFKASIKLSDFVDLNTGFFK